MFFQAGERLTGCRDPQRDTIRDACSLGTSVGLSWHFWVDYIIHVLIAKWITMRSDWPAKTPAGLCLSVPRKVEFATCARARNDNGAERSVSDIITNSLKVIRFTTPISFLFIRK